MVEGVRWSRPRGRGVRRTQETSGSSTPGSSAACNGARGRRWRSSPGSRSGSWQADGDYRLRDWLLSRQRYWGRRSRSSTARCGARPGAGRPAPVELPDTEDYAPRGRPAGSSRGLRQDHVPGCGGGPRGARRHDGHVRGLVLVLPALLDPADDGRLGPRGRAQLDAGRPVHRRRRARDPAPAARALFAPADMDLLDVQEPFAPVHAGMVELPATTARRCRSRGQRRLARGCDRPLRRRRRRAATSFPRGAAQ